MSTKTFFNMAANKTDHSINVLTAAFNAKHVDYAKGRKNHSLSSDNCNINSEVSL